jgi:hypothetical protein
VIDEQYAVEMVDLMLQAGGQQPVGLDLVPHAGVVVISHLDASRSGDVGVLTGQGQARVACSSLLAMISGLISTIGARVSSGIRSTTASRSPTPTCGAANPIPGAAYMVANMRGSRSRTVSASAGFTSRVRAFKIGFGAIRMASVGASGTGPWAGAEDIAAM